MSSSTAEVPATGDAPGDATSRAGPGLADGDAPGVRSGVGMGVRTLRVSVAAAPGTGVGSALNSVEQPAIVTVATSARAYARRATTFRV
jgi:hypothetical protein